MRRKIQKPLALLLAFAMMFCMVPAAGFAADNGDSEAAVERIAGQNRWETAALTAVEKYGTNDTVIIARGDDDGNFADGLAASYLAKVKDAPILLTNPNSLPDATEKAIKDLNAQNAIVLGGELAVSEAVVNELEGLELEVERIEGGDRFGTAAAIAKAGGNADTALVVSGYAPADSLVAGPVAFNNDYPVLLVQKDSVPPATEDAIEELGIDNILVVGGETVISDAVYNALDADDRYAGYTRIDTSVVVADELFEEPETFTIVGRQDKNLADAVGAAVLGNPILYVGNDISDIEEYLNEVITADTQFVILGGTNAVNEAVENALNELAPEEEGLVVESVSAINANTISVTFEGMEPVEITLETPLVHGQTEVTFVYEGVEYTATLSEAYTDPAVVDAEAAKAVEDAIAALPAVDELTLEDAETVAAARADYEALTEAQKALVTNLAVLEAAEARIAELEAEAAEQAKAEAIENAINTINLIGNPATLTLEDEAKVVAARAAVDAALELGAVETDIVNYDHLLAAEEQIKALKDELDAKETALQDAIVALTNLPMADKITLEDKEQVEAARALVVAALAFDGVEESDLLNLWKLEAAEAKIAELEAAAADAEAAKAVEDAIAALPAVDELTLEDAEAVANARAAYEALTEAQKALVPNLAVLEAAEAKIAELEEIDARTLKVVEVSAINHYGVTVTFPEVTEAIEDANVVVKDGEGNIIETKPMLLAEGATQADFEFVTPFAEDYEFTGVWTVNGEPYSFDAINQLAAIAAAVEDGNEVKLQAALDAAGITYEDETKMPEYLSALEEEGATESLEAVQKAISEIDENAAELGNKEAAVKAVAGAKTQAQLLAALEANFKLVNPDWIVQYDEDTNVNISTTEGLTDFEEAFNNIQEAIYAVNATEVAPEVEAAFMSLDSEKVAKARILVTNWIPAGEEDEVTIKDWALDGLALEDALIAVNNAKTNSALKSALVNLDNLENELLEKYEDVTDIEGIGDIWAINSEKIEAVVVDKFDIETVKDENLTAYRTAIEATELKNKNQRSDIQAIIDKVNSDTTEKAKEDVLAALNKVDSKTAAADVVALLEQNQKLNELENKVNPAYAEAYKTAVLEAIAEAAEEDDDAFSDASAVDTLVGKVNKAEDAAALLAAVNTATTPADMSKALIALEAGQDPAVTEFTNLSSQEKLEVAEIVIALRNVEEGNKFASADAALKAVAAEDTGAIAIRSAFLTEVNGATDISGMRAALDNEDLFPEFFALDVTEKTEKAELVLNALNELKALDPAEEFETIAEIKAAAGLLD